MRRLSLIILLSFLSVSLFAQSPEQMGGTYYAYPGPPEEKVSLTAPEGYSPFYISHYGRHGSRWMTNDQRYKAILEPFTHKDNLTPFGKQVEKMLQKAWRNAQGNGGMLTPLGALQHKGIAQRMSGNFPEIFQNGEIGVQAFSSTYPRCRASMKSFTGELLRLNPSIEMDISEDKSNMDFIAYTPKELKDFEDRLYVPVAVSPDRLMGVLFKDPSKVKDQENLLRELYFLASDMQDIPLDIDLLSIFSREELLALYGWNNKKMHLLHGKTAQNGGMAQKASIPLWENIVSLSDKALEGNDKSATLRFGHDSNLMRLLTLMDMDYPYPMDQVLPMAANLQMVFYRKNCSPTLVKFLLNEREVTLPIESPYPHFYRWDDVKAHVGKRIERLKHLEHLNTLPTMVGTAASVLESAGRYGKGSEEKGQTLPAVLSPNGQSFWTPQTRATEKKCVSPYYYADTLFHGIRCSHWIVGGCTQDWGSFTISAMGGDLRTAVEDISTPFSHSEEISHPHYYSVRLPREGLRVEVTSTSHCASIRITPEKDGPVHIVLTPNSDEGQGFSTADSEGRILYSCNPVHRIYQGKGLSAGFSGHMVLTYGFPAEAGVKDACSYISFQGVRGKSVEIKASCSFTGKEGALSNLKTELSDKDFEKTADLLSRQWCERFHRIDVESKDTLLMREFYAALYRASFLPRELSDCDGSYPKFASGEIIMGEGKHFTDYSMWDTYRALHPLLALLEPTLDGQMMQSLADMYSQGGWMPIFPCWNSYTAAMIGDHCASAIADAYVKGIRNFDAQKAYEGLRKNAFDSPSEEEYLDGKGRRALTSYLRYGYIPLEDPVEEAYHKKEQSSRTLEYAYDDFALSCLAKALGKGEDHAVLAQRSENWRNVFNEKGWVAGRHSDGSFEPLSDVTVREDFLTEGASCHYSWYVPQNVEGLIGVMGGEDEFCSRLDALFEKGYYWHGNEPCHQVAYLYNFAGQPWKTQKWVRRTLSSEYAPFPGGLSGNDDAGQMSAWYVFSTMGFYPVCPGIPYYSVGSPAFEKVTLNLENGNTFTLNAKGASRENIYILNSSKTTISHEEIISGKTVDFEMGPNPDIH